MLSNIVLLTNFPNIDFSVFLDKCIMVAVKIMTTAKQLINPIQTVRSYRIYVRTTEKNIVFTKPKHTVPNF